MNPSQNFFCGALALNDPQPFRYHSPRPGCRIEYHIAASVDLPPPQRPALRAGLAAEATSRALTQRTTRIDRILAFLRFCTVASPSAARVCSVLAGTAPVTDSALLMADRT